ncbi:uncharacterized protein B0H18DRAFT_130364 [Fomitopsis serialis]|uniref:uncharacterized protein n=1 Tax=Fomitopsis serialis TaxID=139415 RepID=UPI0020086CB4|nr:uncharacterized protein B0H18DRAFT_130364 [Neoantrodia serialis]KAH9930637.1 hypothetical protein B0H18DRAFT_130364 [Neoantrodia serialis]
MACRWLREACISLLLSHCSLLVYEPGYLEHPEIFLPAPLRPYVRSLTLRDECIDQQCADLDDDMDTNLPLYYTDDPRLCGAFPGAFLAERLREAPHLTSLTMHKQYITTHGLPWDTLRVALSVPHLREFKFRNFYFCPVLRAGEELDVDSLAPLTSFHYRMHHPRRPWSFPPDMAALAYVLGKLCETLETLVLSSEPAPLSTLAECLVCESSSSTELPGWYCPDLSCQFALECRAYGVSR